MARSTSAGHLLSVVANGLGQPLSSLRERTLADGADWRPGSLPGAPDWPDIRRRHYRLTKRARRVFFRRCVPLAMAALLVLALGLLVFRVVYDDRIYPAVIVGDVPVGGLTRAQAEARVLERASTLEVGTISFTFENRIWTPPLSDLGVTVDIDRSIVAAEALGRDGDAGDRLSFLGGVLDTDAVVPIQMQLDRATLDAWFDKVDRELGRAPVDASLVIDGTSVSVAPGADGLGVDRDASTALLERALTTLEPVAEPLPTRILFPEISDAALAPVREDVARAISEPLAVTFEGQQWTIAPETIASFVQIETAMAWGVPAAELTVDTEGLASVLRTQFTPLVNRKPADAVLGWNNGLVTVTPSVTGAVLKTEAFADAVARSVMGDRAPVEIPVVLVKPEIDDANLGAYGIDTLLGAGDSNFEGGSWARDENVQVGTRLLNGELVPPGGTFSFNKAVGVITSDRGFQEADVVIAEQVTQGVGGGICQVSTTVFRAAIHAGMPITEWYPHSFRLPNYERDGWGPGFDASILQMGPDPESWADFKFQNYSDSWLLVESTIAYPHVYVNIYGSGDGRAVDVDSWAIGGNAFAFSRVIRDAQGAIIAERTFETYFV